MSLRTETKLKPFDSYQEFLCINLHQQIEAETTLVESQNTDK